MVEMDKFMNDFMSLNMEGNPFDTFDKYNEVMASYNGVKTVEGGEYTFDYIVKKYKKYLDYWDRQFGNKDPKYISGKDKRKSPYDYIKGHHFQEVYEEKGSLRDKYLFGKYGKDELLKLTDKFKIHIYEQEQRTKGEKSDFDVLSNEESDPFIRDEE